MTGVGEQMRWRDRGDVGPDRQRPTGHGQPGLGSYSAASTAYRCPVSVRCSGAGDPGSGPVTRLPPITVFACTAFSSPARALCSSGIPTD